MNEILDPIERLQESLAFSRKKHFIVGGLFLMGSVALFWMIPPLFSAWVLWIGKAVGFLMFGVSISLLVWAYRSYSPESPALKKIMEHPEEVVWIYLGPDHKEARPRSAKERGNIFVAFRDGSQFAFPLLFVEMERIVSFLVQQCPHSFLGFEQEIQDLFEQDPLQVLERAQTQTP